MMRLTAATTVFPNQQYRDHLQATLDPTQRRHVHLLGGVVDPKRRFRREAHDQQDIGNHV